MEEYKKRRREKLIEYIIKYLPSKDLKESYFLDIKNGKYPNFSDDELYAIVMTHIAKENTKIAKECLKGIGYISNDYYLIKKIEGQLKHYKEHNVFIYGDVNQNKKYSYKEDIVFVNYKTLFKPFDLIKCKTSDGNYRYGIVDNYDYNCIKKGIRVDRLKYKNNCYKCYLLEDINLYSIKYFFAHKDSAESCTFDELPDQQKKAFYQYYDDAGYYYLNRRFLVDSIDKYGYIAYLLEKETKKYEKHVSTFSNGYIQYLVERIDRYELNLDKSELYDIVKKYLQENFKLYGIFPKESWHNDWIRWIPWESGYN